MALRLDAMLTSRGFKLINPSRKDTDKKIWYNYDTGVKVRRNVVGGERIITIYEPNKPQTTFTLPDEEDAAKEALKGLK